MTERRDMDRDGQPIDGAFDGAFDGASDGGFEAWLDGLLDAEASRKFAEDLARSAPLQVQHELQKRIDDALARRFPAPAGDERTAMLGRINAAVAAREADAHAPALIATSETVARRVPRWPLAIAAAILLGVTAWLLGPALMDRLAPSKPTTDRYAGLEKQTLTETYDAEVANGFVPTVICRDAEEFSRWFEEQFRTPLAFDAGDGIEALGLGYSRSVSRRTIHLLATVDGEPVVVFIDRNPAIGQDAVPRDGLYIHESQLGPLRLYEASTFPEPRVMSRLSSD